MQTEHDYISRKEILEFLNQLEVISEKLHDEIVESAVDATIGAIRKLVGLAKEQDVVPVRHGKWIDRLSKRGHGVSTYCSCCGQHSGIGGIESNRHRAYCPNCGAKMDKDGDSDV